MYDNPVSCCSYSRNIDNEYIAGGVWDNNLNICLGGSSVYKDSGQCFGGDELSKWNLIENNKTSTPTI